MRVRSFEELMLLPEGAAVARHLDGVTWNRVRWFLAGFLLAAVVVASISSPETAPLAFWAAVADAALLAGFFTVRNTRPVEEAFRPVVAVLVALQFAATLLWASDAELVLVVALLPFPALLLLLRFRPGECALVVATLTAGTFAWHVGYGEPASRAALLALAVAGPAAAAAVGSQRLTASRRKEFLERWHRAVTRERERLRLRGELADARKIQLSMLPAGEPRIEWLELSGTCVPAAEVGGDYYDYIDLGREAWTLVMADVAGHGVASGLLLAGLRSSLYVLQEELRSPAAVLERLNAMVRASVRMRTFVTVSLAVLDRSGGDQGRLRLSSAGHPPGLLWRAAEGAVVEVGLPAPPLGTRLPAVYEDVDLELGPGDVLLLYTDGLVEAIDFRAESYGFERLERAFARAARAGEAREVRTHLLEDVSHFKGSTPQADDLSIVVARYRPERAGRG